MISSAGDGALSVFDPSSNARGRLVNGAFALASPLQVKAASPAGTASALHRSGRHADERAHLRRAGLQRHVTIDFKQSIGATEPLRTGTYSKTLTFTLSTTQP